MSAKLKKSPDQENREQIASLYFLLSSLLHREIDEELRGLLGNETVKEIFVKAEPGTEAILTRDWKAIDYEDVAVDFCALFIIGESSKAPRAAAWLDEGSSIGPEGIHGVVDAFVNEHQMILPPGIHELPRDHASVIFYVAGALRQMDSPQSAEFELATLGSWISDLGAGLERASSPIYQSVGRLLSAV